MPIQYSNPIAAISDGLKQALLEREEAQRRAQADQLARDREARLKAQDAAQLEVARANAASLEEQRRSAAEARATTRATQVSKNLVPGVVVGDDTTKVLQEGGMGDLVRDDADSITATLTDIDAAGQPVAGAPVDVQSVGPQTYLGTQDQQNDQRQVATFQKMLENPDLPEDVRLAVQFALGGKTVPTELIKDDEAPGVYWVSPDKKQMMRRNPTTNSFEPFTGEIPKGATILQAAQPSSASVSVNLGADAVDLAAWQYLQTGTLPALGMGASNTRAQVLQRAAELAKQGGGINPQANAASYMADRNALTQVTRSLTAITAFENTAQRNIGLMQDAMKKVTDTGIPILNRPIRSLQEMTGNPDVARFNASLRIVVPEVARIETQPNLTGQLTDSARHEMQQVLRGEATVEQTMNVVEMLLVSMKGRKTDLEAQKKHLESGINSRGPAGFPGVVAPGSPSSPASGGGSRIRYDINGQRIE